MTGSVMWYNNAPIYPGSVAGISGVALAGNIWYVNEKTKIISMPIHQTGKLLLTTANVEVNLSSLEFILLAESAPINIPIKEMITVAVVKSKIVLGSFSIKMSFTLDEPESLVRNVA